MTLVLGRPMQERYRERNADECTSGRGLQAWGLVFDVWGTTGEWEATAGDAAGLIRKCHCMMPRKIAKQAAEGIDAGVAAGDEAARRKGRASQARPPDPTDFRCRRTGEGILSFLEKVQHQQKQQGKRGVCVRRREKQKQGGNMAVGERWGERQAGRDRKTRRVGDGEAAHQNWGKLSLSSAQASWASRSRSRVFLPSFCVDTGVVLRFIEGRL